MDSAADSVIRVLPADVIDQIAAGEVIERPASVVKELVDNAIDAGAKMIAIETAAGGKSLIRVTDDGSGMSAADARLALQPHATSKIRGVDDLWTLVTMGFRGEALPSIASVSRLVLTTRRAGDVAAMRLEVVAGRIESESEVGAPAGTTIEISELLANVPARLKFLRGEQTEASHVTELVAKLAMAHPRLHLRLRHNGRTALDAPPDRDAAGRARALLGPRVGSRLVVAEGEETGVRVTALLGAPEHAQTTGRGVQLFVGRRPVRDRGLLHAVCMGYGELVPRGRYPVAIVMIDVAAGAVDVNVHPQKHEVRFADAGAVCAAVRHVVQAAVAGAPWRAEHAGGAVQMTAIASMTPPAPALPFDGPASPLAERYASQLREARVAPIRQLGFADTMPAEPADGDGMAMDVAVGQTSAAAAGARAWVRDVKDRVRASRAAEVSETKRGYARAAEYVDAMLPALARSEAASAPAYFARLRFLGQLDLTFLVCEGDGELVLVDQHSAHERVELARRFARGVGDVPIQKLLFPLTFDATAAELAQVERDGGVLAQVGFEVEAFGKSTLAIKSAPAGVRDAEPAQLLRALLARWEREAPTEAALKQQALAEIACHAAIRAGDRLTAGEAEALLASLDDAFAAGGPDPHGRPVLLRLPLAELARRFGR